MSDAVVVLGKKKESTFLDKVKQLLPEEANLNLCLTCGACSSGCPASGLMDMDPRKLLRMAALGLDEEGGLDVGEAVSVCRTAEKGLAPGP